MKKVLTIAGSDCSGGAGIQADIKTMTAHKVYGMSVVTALTAQNTTGVYGVMEAGADFVAEQIDCVFRDIRPDAVKIGMVSNSGIIEVIADKLTYYHAEKIVVDPVMVSTSGSRLLNEDALHSLKTYLLPIADVITPNIFEAEILCGHSIENKEKMLRAAEYISENIQKPVLIKGGHFEDCADDLFYSIHEGVHWFLSERIENNNTHGTGCTLSSAIACNLALERTLMQSIANAKKYISGALLDGLDLGHGCGPLNHCYCI